MSKTRSIRMRPTDILGNNLMTCWLESRETAK